ncbi:hypothetical protein Hanom_Chr04g00316961 [Helianthus anomalus]
MTPLYTLTTTLLTLLITCSTSTPDDAYPSPYTATCDLNNIPIPIRSEVYDNGRIIDITHRYHPEMPSWG